MRCPKCGFISFDHLSSCAKCGRDISGVASELQGTSIKVEIPMFLSGALAAFSESAESFDEHAMEAEVDEGGIDFHMEMEGGEEEAIEVTATEDDVDFSFEEEAEEPQIAQTTGISLAEAEAEEAAGVEEEPEDAAALELGAEAEEEPALESAEESFEELDFMGAVDEEEEGGLEFDLEDFIEDMDDEKTKKSGNDEASDVDLDLGDEE